MLALIDRYRFARDISAGYADQLRYAVSSYSRFLGRPAAAPDLNRDSVNRWLFYLQERGYAAETVRSRRRAILAIWRFAADEGLVAEGPQKIRSIRGKSEPIEGFDVDELRQLLAAAGRLRGKFRQLPHLERRHYFTALLLVLWDSGLRIGDVLSIERDWIWPGGFISIVQSKTKDCIRRQLRPETMAAIDKISTPQQRMIFPPFGCRRTFFRAFKRLVKSAGLRGTSKWIRRSSATYAELAMPGGGRLQCGHRTHGLFERHYAVTKLIQNVPPMPPSLVE